MWSRKTEKSLRRLEFLTRVRKNLTLTLSEKGRVTAAKALRSKMCRFASKDTLLLLTIDHDLLIALSAFH